MIKIVYKNLKEISPYDHNPRKNDKAVEVVANSIREFGFKVPVVLDKDNIIIAGHTRVKAALMLGLEKVPCIIASDLNEEQVKAFRLADNKIGEIAEWDLDLLNLELTEIEMDMSEFGFETFDMDEFDNEFDLPDGDKSNLEQITFTLASEQAKEIREALALAKMGGAFNEDTFGNENSNGNALYRIIVEWKNQK